MSEAPEVYAAATEAAGPCDAELADMAVKAAAVVAHQQQGLPIWAAFNASAQTAWECLQKHAGAAVPMEHTTELGRVMAVAWNAKRDAEVEIRNTRATVLSIMRCVHSCIEHIKRIVPRGKPKQKVSEGL